jgi:ATP-dependent Lon protease
MSEPKDSNEELKDSNEVLKDSNEELQEINEVEDGATPLLPLRDVVVFPHMVVPLFVGRPKSIKAMEVAMEGAKNILLATQKSASEDEPSFEDLFKMGCLASILQMLKLPDGTVKVLVEGVERATIEEICNLEDYLSVKCTPQVHDVNPGPELEALRRTLLNQFEQFVKLNKKVPTELINSLTGVEDFGRLADTIAAHLPLKIEDKQEILETPIILQRMEKLLAHIETELDILQVEKRIRGRVKRQMEKSQRDYYLNEQVKAIQKELGEGEDGELDELDKKIKLARMPKEAREKAKSELKKLKMMSPMSAEATVVRNYIDSLVALPWKKKSKLINDLVKAEKVLEEDHHGLEKVKERIIEYLAVQHRVDKVKAPIMCLVGPPGVGKTSLGQSIARATGRRFVRMALGGVRDEAEIRGHRKTYIGSMPGKILTNLSKLGVRNPLFLLDEVDKIGTDYRGDPASALLEVLDPEQNNTFVDHYIEVEFDLSDVMFVATANSLNIPPALLDRLEVIRLSGYTEDEKINIATRYLLPKQLKASGLVDKEIDFTNEALKEIVRVYTREAGVRSLEREISKVCRKVTRKVITDPKHSKITIGLDNLSDYLGVEKFTYGVAEKVDQVGEVMGLAWTEVGGELLTIEATAMTGKGQIIRTGSLGDVMKESVEAARSVVRARAKILGIANDVFEKMDIHVHAPEGATPKDGPSAGIAMTTAIVSALTKVPVRHDVAMTGEITLRGEVLQIGGLKEKLLAAHRGGIKRVLIPEQNSKDLVEIPSNIKDALEIIPVRWIDKVLELALSSVPTPLDDVVEVKSSGKKDSSRANVKH